MRSECSSVGEREAALLRKRYSRASEPNDGRRSCADEEMKAGPMSATAAWAVVRSFPVFQL